MTATRPAAALIVEDQPFVGMVTSDILKEAGLETLHAWDAADALALLRSHPEVGLLVTEAHLPGSVDGVELSRRVSAERPDVRVIVTSDTPEIGASDMPAGTRILRKPYASDDLRTMATGPASLDA